MLRALRRKIGNWIAAYATADARLVFALNKIIELRELTRRLSADSPACRARAAQTKASFDLQWDELPTGVQLLGSPKFEREAQALVELYTGLPATWFKDRSILDVGCGNGRWSYALSRLGARVTAIDASENGVANAQKHCGAFPGFSARGGDLLEPLGVDRQFDLVWSFGVAHHTGNTQLCVANFSEAVRPGAPYS
jgi:2-polyprenyl-3-methyl-5-hydroxy-6-metoxy-1,4-benzoquinol methylase